PHIMWELREGKTDWPTYQRTQVELIKKGRFVLNAALRPDKIKSLPTVEEQQHPVDWLGKELGVDFLPGSEILRISLSGDRPEDLAALANAVAQAYLEEIGGQDEKDRLARYDQLKEASNGFERRMKDLQTTWQGMAQDADAPDPKTFEAKQTA